MLFEVGETVVYPHHGAATIVEVKNRTIRGEKKMYLKLNVKQGDLTIEVPAENVDLVGVRDVIGKEGLDKVFEVLRAPLHRRAHQLVSPLQGEPGKACVWGCHQGLRGWS